MSISNALLPEFDQEMANTRKTLARIPDDKLDWRPHEKSMTMGQLANHLAQMPGWGVETLRTDSVDIAVIRGLILNHGIHHRAQLGVYFRLNGIPVPAVYGPSADEKG